MQRKLLQSGKLNRGSRSTVMTYVPGHTVEPEYPVTCIRRSPPQWPATLLPKEPRIIHAHFVFYITATCVMSIYDHSTTPQSIVTRCIKRSACMRIIVIQQFSQFVYISYGAIKLACAGNFNHHDLFFDPSPHRMQRFHHA